MIYFQPEKYGLTPLGDIDPYDEPYEFNMVAFWQNEAGDVLWACDSGCSCPSPFEDTRVEDLNVVTSWQQATKEILEYFDYGRYASESDKVAKDKVQAYISDIRRKVNS